MRFDREDMLELTGNLLDNACKWSKRQVEVEVTYQNGVAICVADDGPGCSEDEMSKLARRGLRLDEAVQGHGLGLGIVRDIAQSYGGTLQIARDEKLGGLLATVNFPVQVAVQMADNLDRRITPSA
jgi:signal transduction histidine kinase